MLSGNIRSAITRLRKAREALLIVVPIFRKYRLRILGGFISLLGVDLLQLLIPRVIRSAVDSLQSAAASGDSLLRHSFLIVSLALGIAACRFGWRYLVLGFSRMMERDVRNMLMAKLVTLDRPFFQRRTTGEIMALSSNDLPAVQMACGIGLISFVDAIMMTAASLAFMAYIHPGLTIIALAPMPILALLTGLMTAILHRRFSRVQEQFSRMTEFARSTLSAIQLIKAYNQEGFQTEHFDKQGRDYVKNNLRLATVQGALFPFSTLIANTSLLLVVFFGGRLTITGVISIGDFVAFMTYLFLMTWPMMAIGWVTTLFQRGLTSLDRIGSVIGDTPVLHDPTEPLPLPDEKRTISIRNLNFRYQGPDTASVLTGINLEIKPGLIGIVGKTGSGKTTLCQLLARIYPVSADHLFMNSIDYNHLSLSELRSQIAYVPQDTLLFSDTIAANITFGKPGASQQEMEHAARMAAIHDEITGFREGYQSRIGEKGVLLSGGQRQRIALARAILMDRPLMIIDDGLSAVDTDTEHRIINAFEQWLPGRTCIIVSHRVAPILDADAIFVMDSGRIVAHGNHAELVAENKFYRTIFHHQMSLRGGGN